MTEIGMNRWVDEYCRLTPTSRKLFERACRVLPNGTTRTPFVYKPYPFYVKRSMGCRVWDVDDREYIDYVNNYGPLLVGHCHPRVIEAVKHQVNTFQTGGPTEIEVRMAERIVKQVPGAEYVQFFPSGTEACWYALRAARAYSNKDKFVMIEGGYHGASDNFYAGKSKGIPKDVGEKVIKVPFNDAEAMETAVKAHKDQLAAVFLEPMLGGHAIASKEGYLKEVRRITDENDVLLVLDEVITGFRIAPGGAQQRFNVTADICTFGKILGGGFGNGAMTFRKDVAKLFTHPDTPTLEIGTCAIPHPGTFNSVAVTWAAGLATLDELTPQAYDHLEDVGNSIRTGLRKILLELRMRAYVSGIASVFNIHFTDKEVLDAKAADAGSELLRRVFDLHMLNQGINLCKAHGSYCSTPMTSHEIDQTLTAARRTLEAMKPVLRKIAPELTE